MDGIMDGEAQFQVVIGEVDVGDKRVGKIFERARPAFFMQPRERAVDPDAGAVAFAERLILLADARVVKIAHAVGGIEIDEQLAVANRKISGHGDSVQGFRVSGFHGFKVDGLRVFSTLKPWNLETLKRLLPAVW